MSWATKRKLLYFFGALLIVVAVLAYPVYSVVHVTATCSDGIQNQGEEGIDCGGPCEALCKAAELSPIVLWQQVFQITPRIYTAAAYIQNPNVNAEAFSVPYTFKIYDVNGSLLGTRTGKTLIPSGGHFAVLETNISIATATPARALFSFGDSIHWRVARQLSHLVVKNATVLNASTSPEIDATVINSSPKSSGQINVAALVYDQNGNAFTASRTVISGMAANSNAPIIFTWPLPFQSPVSHIEIIPIIQ